MAERKFWSQGPMNGENVIQQVLSCIEPSGASVSLVRKRHQPLLALPAAPAAAARTLGLYQPQRRLARLMAATIRRCVASGVHTWILPSLAVDASAIATKPPYPRVTSGSCGVMLGNPEHRIRRAIACYETDDGWEVAKIAFGPHGANLLQGEAVTLRTLGERIDEIPAFLGIHHAGDITLLRMRHVTGTPISRDQRAVGMKLLDSWISNNAPRPISEFAEWPAIRLALEGSNAVHKLASMQLTPVLSHGDFARWNLLLQADGTLKVLDWEWGIADGLPGIDLVHYVLQDDRLVDRLPDTAAIAACCEELSNAACRSYLDRTGWNGDPLLAVIACLAYKQGAEHQDNHAILAAALSMLK